MIGDWETDGDALISVLNESVCDFRWWTGAPGVVWTCGGLADAWSRGDRQRGRRVVCLAFLLRGGGDRESEGNPWLMLGQ